MKVIEICRNIGVFYQEPEELKRFVSSFEKSEVRSVYRNGGFETYSTYDHGNVRYRENTRYKTCRLNKDHDVSQGVDPRVYNIAGLRLQGLVFCGGVYDAETLNYINSRVRIVSSCKGVGLVSIIGE